MGVMQAKYAGWCAIRCGQPIKVGDEIVYVDDVVVHADCEGRALARARLAQRPPCDECFCSPCACIDRGDAA